MTGHEAKHHIVVLSGKGGTGKTTLTAAFAQLAGNIVVTDCDVDAADLFILLKPDKRSEQPFYGGKKATILNDLCSHCGLCMDVCRFGAIGNFSVDAVLCEGCGFCYHVCPSNAIDFSSARSGTRYEGSISGGSEFLSASLLPGEGNSGKLVTELKRDALRFFDQPQNQGLLLDGPPGIGCPVNASLSGADRAVLITEPTLSGLHDLKRIVTLIRSFAIEMSVVINKYDLNEEMTREIEAYARTEHLRVAGRIPFDHTVVEALQRNMNIMAFPASPAAQAIGALFYSLNNRK